jgi:hypothetical protein
LSASKKPSCPIVTKSANREITNQIRMIRRKSPFFEVPLGSRDPTNPIQGVLVMRSKLLLGVAAPALAALTLAATSAPASAQWRGWGWGWGGAAVAAGVIGGAALAAAATSPYYGYGYGYPAYSYGYAPGYYGQGYGYGYGYAPTPYGYGYGSGWEGAYGRADAGPVIHRRVVRRHVAPY